MDGKAQLVVSPVIDLILPKGNVTDRQIVEVPAIRGFKACHRDIGLGVELFRNTSADGIQLHTVQAAVLHFLREHTEEIAHAHGRLQDIAGLKAQIANGLVDGPNDGGSSIVGV